MTQKELIKALSLETDFTQGDIKIVLDALPTVVGRALLAADQDEVVELPGIVRLKKSMTPHRKERKQYNAMLKRNVVIPEKLPEPTVRPYATAALLDIVRG